MPVTATRKVDKPTLRREGWWRTTDPILVRDGSTYRPLAEADRRELLETFAEHDRSALHDR